MDVGDGAPITKQVMAAAVEGPRDLLGESSETGGEP